MPKETQLIERNFNYRQSGYRTNSQVTFTCSPGLYPEDTDFFFFFLWLPCDIWSVQARDQILVATAAYATAVAMPEPQHTALGGGGDLCPCAPEMTHILLRHSRNANNGFFKKKLK